MLQPYEDVFFLSLHTFFPPLIKAHLISDNLMFQLGLVQAPLRNGASSTQSGETFAVQAEDNCVLFYFCGISSISFYKKGYLVRTGKTF